MVKIYTETYEKTSPFVNDFSFMNVQTLSNSAWVTHGPFAMWITSRLKPNLYAELGSHYEYSFFSVCQAMKELDYGGKAMAIDTWQGDEHAGFYSSKVFDYVKKVRDEKYPDIGVMTRSTFDEALEVVQNGSVDLLLIDGLHTYEAVLHDYETWLPKMSDRGIMMFHDIEVYGRGFGVFRIWEVLEKQYPSFSFKHGHGLGIIKVGSEATPVDELFNVDNETRDQIRTVYEMLGEKAGVRRQVERLESSQTATRKKIERQFKSSFSWKITKPLRVVHKLTRKF
jgi:hypothetical protein